MRIVVDTNIIFSPLLNPNCNIAKIILKPKSKLNFYSSFQLKLELDNHNDKIKKITGFTDSQIKKSKSLLLTKIRFIREELIPKRKYDLAIELTNDIDVDDILFVALAEHSSAKLWTGDKPLF